MTRVTWDDAGERRYRAGVARGMLYVGDLAVPWSGLASVTETPVVNSPGEIYLDGRKVQNVPAGEDFTATIEAFSSPIEFAPCAGRLLLETGLYVTDQPKQTFGFSYQTRSGDDINGTSLDYRIHVIFNATAKISDFTHVTISDKVTPQTQRWDIAAVPVEVTGTRPTSHFVVDSRLTTADMLSMMDVILYGDSDNDPRMPTLTELAELLTT